MDCLLREIQVELAPDREPEPALSPEADPPLAHAGPDPEPGPGPEPEPDLEPEPEPPPPLATATPTAVTAPPTSDPQIQALTELSARLLASIRELLVGYERVLVRPSSQSRPEQPQPQPPAPPRVRRRPDDSDVTLSAAPFASLEALHEFEQAVASLPGVREVAVRGYEGTDRAIIEVRLRREDPAPRG
jgi:pyruvate/2-oxoglutarate dehydrogenase complex dihydrolipoamide acyltransferase (E2) component